MLNFGGDYDEAENTETDLSLSLGKSKKLIVAHLNLDAACETVTGHLPIQQNLARKSIAAL